MPRVATKLTPTKSGGFTARKRIPEDTQDEYERLFGLRWEERLSVAPGTPVLRRAQSTASGFRKLRAASQTLGLVKKAKDGC